MTNTWQSYWKILESNSDLQPRAGQQLLGGYIFNNLFFKGHLVGEAPTGVGKSFAALIPAIAAVRENKHRTIVTTETLNLLDQIVDKDLPFLAKVYDGFTYAGLKGRNHYLCIAKAGRDHPTVQKVSARLGSRGERRDVERILGKRLDDDDWADICGETEFCSNNQCEADFCYSTAARNRAANADIVITSHKMLQVHGEFIQNGTDGGLLGDFEHIIVDEAHSFEQVVVDGMTFEVAPWDMVMKLSAINKAADALTKYGPDCDFLERKMKSAFEIIKNIFEFQTSGDWASQSMALGVINILGGNPSHEMALDLYENTLPGLVVDISQGYQDLANKYTSELKSKSISASTKSKVRRGVAACGYLASTFGLLAHSIRHPHGTVEAYGTTFALFADGVWGRDYKGENTKAITLRAVPLDVSQFLIRNLWRKSLSVTCISATLRDQTNGSFTYLKNSLGLSKEAKEIVVDSPFDFASQQLIYLTKGINNVAPVYGAKFNIDELKEIIHATSGRTLVLFTALKELEYVADELKKDPNFPYKVLVQEKGVDKTELADTFKADTSSVLLASRSFFQGFDAPGETLTSVVMVKYSNPRYDETMKALIRHWRERGFPRFYEMKSMETFIQAFGRGVRSSECKVVCSLLDVRVAEQDSSVSKTVNHVLNQVYPHSEVTSDVNRIAAWLSN